MTEYIIREDAYMALTGDITDCTIEEYIARLREKLSKSPSVTPKEKIGHWYIRETYPLECESWECSECKEVVYEKTKYCPNCGARMIEP